MSGRCRAVLTAVALSVVGCAARDVSDAGADATSSTTDSATDSACVFCFDAGGLTDGGAPTPPDALPPPAVACSDAGEGATECPLPSSICADPNWLEYFDNGVCVDGGCDYQTELHRCGDGCADGGCVVFHSTVPSP